MTARPLLGALLLAALVPSVATAYRISDPLAAKPTELRVTITLPPGFAILKGSAKLNVTATDPRSDEAAISSDPLVETDATGPDHVLALADPAGAQFAGLEAKVAAWRAAGVPTAAQIDVTFIPCRTNPSADPAQPMALSLQPAPRAPRLVLVPAGTALAAYLTASGEPIAACP